MARLAPEELADCRRDLSTVGFEGEVAGVVEVYFSIGIVAWKRLGPGGRKEGVVPAPDREQRRSLGCQVFAELRIERDIARMVEEQLDL